MKAGFRVLTEIAGSQDAAALACRVSKATISRWCSAAYAEVPPLAAVAALQRFTGQTIVSDILAGYAEADFPIDDTRGAMMNLTSLLGDVARSFADRRGDDAAISARRLSKLAARIASALEAQPEPAE